MRSQADIEKLSVAQVREKLTYVDKALRILRKELGDQTALIGFAGSPWTLATFMMEGGSAEKYTRALNLFRKEPKNFLPRWLKNSPPPSPPISKCKSRRAWMPSRFSTATAGCLRRRNFRKRPGAGCGKSFPGFGGDVPVIVFSLGTHGNWDDLIATGASVLGIDWRFPLADARRLLPARHRPSGKSRAGALSDATPEEVAAETSRLLEAMRERKGYIFNLGHGVPPDAKLENIAALVETVKNFK